MKVLFKKKFEDMTNAEKVWLVWFREHQDLGYEVVEYPSGEFEVRQTKTYSPVKMNGDED